MSRSLTIEDKTGLNEPLETPTFIVPTEYGLIPNITPDLAEDFPLYFYAGDFVNTALPKNAKASTSLGLSKRWIFLGPSSDFYNFDEGPSKKGVRMYQRNGTLAVVSNEEYEKLIDFVKPQGTVTLHSFLSDATSSRQKNIRTQAAKEYAADVATKDIYKETIVFTPSTAEQKDTCLFVQFCGPFTENESLTEMIKSRPENKPRMIFFDGNPRDVWRAVNLGFDLFVASYPVYMAKHYTALTFEFDTFKDDSEEEKDVGIDLRSREFEHDHKPLVEGCDCICCRDHTRSYLHHLINVHELLAQVFLTQHNLHHYKKFFAHIRSSLKQ